MISRSTPKSADLEELFQCCRRQAGPSAWRRAVAAFRANRGRTPFLGILAREAAMGHAPAHLADLAHLEQRYRRLQTAPPPPAQEGEAAVVNPTLQVIRTEWTGLASLLTGDSPRSPVPGEETLLLWRPPHGGVRVQPAADAELLALKLVAEGLDLSSVARQQGVSRAWLDGILERAALEGLLVPPASRLVRTAGRYPLWAGVDAGYGVASAFTLQWHVTHLCDLHCRHCYDRSRRADLPLEQGLLLLDDLHAFCRTRRVRGQVTFTGGNPLLLPGFEALYGAAVERGFRVAILGNPVPRERVEALVAIEPPELYQVSLEGLQESNDHIRGAGHFQRVLDFLPVLRELGVHAMVMLTLTRDNLGQVLPLAECLRDRVDTFHWNRLSPVGEGAGLAVVPPAAFGDFLVRYLDAADHNPILGLKDNLFNPLLADRGRDLFGGCTGHGCGAAFNFLAVLPDGEAHACRKFPSPVGNVLRDGLAAVYDSAAAIRYRNGSDACRGCRFAAVCGGCLASTRGVGLDPLAARDPYCGFPVG